MDGDGKIVAIITLGFFLMIAFLIYNHRLTSIAYIENGFHKVNGEWVKE